MTFRYCPFCGAPGIEFLEGKRWHCPSCGSDYFRNAAAAAGTIIRCDRGVVFLERALDPGAGKLGLPGGFVDLGERAEEAALRECREEIGWAPPELEYFATYTNRYSFGGVVYDTCDIYYSYRLPEGVELPPLAPRDGESRTIKVLPLEAIRPGDLAFESAARAIAAYAVALAAAPAAKPKDRR